MILIIEKMGDVVINVIKTKSDIYGNYIKINLLDGKGETKVYNVRKDSMAWCLVKNLADDFIKKLRSGEIDPFNVEVRIKKNKFKF
jgi:hypothetical protein